MSRGTLLIFWGTVVTSFDYAHLSFSKFDLFPDFVGYGLVTLGLSRLLPLSKQFVIARFCYWLLIPISVILWFDPSTPISGLLLEWVAVGIETVAIWTLLSGIKAYAERQNLFFLTKWSSAYRLAYVGLIFSIGVLTIVSFVAKPPPTNELGFLFAAGLIVVFLWIVLSLMILDLLYRFKVNLDKQPEQFFRG